LPPYTYSKLNEWLDRISIDEKVHKRKIGLSLGGLDLHCVVINDRKKKKKKKKKKEKKKQKKKENKERKF